MPQRIIGIMGAMHEEINAVVNLLQEVEAHSIGMRTYYTGSINGVKMVVVFSRWGKVAAATTVSVLISTFNITELVFTGVAGAVSPLLNAGDIVVAKRLIQHDMDARPLMPQFEIPLLSKTYFEVPAPQLGSALSAAGIFIERLHDDNELSAIGITAPKVYVGDIASGDKFFASSTDRENLLEKLPDILCVEMEGAAVAQVCYEYEVPFSIIRFISDDAGDSSHLDFSVFLEKVAGRYSAGIIKELFNQQK